MDKRALKIFLSCALGAAIGTLVALKVYQYIWFLGPIVGGVIGYLSYEFENVVMAVKVAWHKVVNFDWQEGIEKFVRGLLIVSSLLSVLPFMYLMLSWMFHLGLLPNIKELGDDVSDALYLLEYLFFFFFFYCLTAWTLIFEIMSLRNNKKSLKKMFLLFNPISVFTYYPTRTLIEVAIFTVTRIIPKVIKCVIPGIVKRIWKGICMFILFLKTVFILIHSELRLLCGINATIGAAIGYFAGYVFIGLVVGGILGVLNYEIISKRWLKLV